MTSQQPLTCEEHVTSGSDDGEEREELGVGERVLDGRSPLDVPAVDERQEHCNRERSCESGG